MEGHGRQRRVGGQFGLAVVGLGEGKGLVKGLAGHPDLKVRVVCDLDAGLAARTAAAYGVPRWTTSVEEAVAEPGVDIVCVYTPDSLHLAHIELALSASKHVICTKPLVNSLAEARRVVELVEAHPGQRLMVGQSTRFFGPMQRQREALERGDLGELSFVEASYVHDMRWFYGQRAWAREGECDLVMACCSHPVDLARWHMGDVVEVHAYADRSHVGAAAGFAGYDTFVVNLRFANGRIGRVLGLYGLEQPHALRPWIEVALYGSKGTFVASYPQLQAVVKLEGEVERQERYFEDVYHYFQFEGVNHHAGEFVNYTEYFARCLVEGEVPQPDAYDGFKTIATLEAIRSSVRSGGPERVERLDAREPDVGSATDPSAASSPGPGTASAHAPEAEPAGDAPTER